MQEYLMVILMGLGTVFFGLICLIALTYAMSAILRSVKKDEAPAAAASAAASAPVEAAIPNRQAMVAAIAAAIAEDMGTDINGLRILSIKKL